MALKNCSECDGKVSGTAKTCPHCGHSLTKGRRAAQEVVDTAGGFLHTIQLIFAFFIVFVLPISLLAKCISG